MSKPASVLGFAQVPIVDNKGNASWNMLQWFQKIETGYNISLTTLGLNPNSPISGTTKTVGGVTSNLSETGTLPTTALSGSVNGSQVGFNLGEVPAGTNAYSVVNGPNLYAVAQVDSANLAIINFADMQHENKTLDNINNGTTYQRFTRVANGQVALGTSLIASGSAATSTVTNAAILATDQVVWAFAGTPASGYAANGSGSLYVLAYVSAGSLSFYVGNSTSSGITPSAQSINYEVIR